MRRGNFGLHTRVECFAFAHKKRRRGKLFSPALSLCECRRPLHFNLSQSGLLNRPHLSHDRVLFPLSPFWYLFKPPRSLLLVHKKSLPCPSPPLLQVSDWCQLKCLATARKGGRNEHTAATKLATFAQDSLCALDTHAHTPTRFE